MRNYIIVFALFYRLTICLGSVDIPFKQLPYDHLLPVALDDYPIGYRNLLLRELLGFSVESDRHYHIEGHMGTVLIQRPDQGPDQGELLFVVYQEQNSEGQRTYWIGLSEAEGSLWDYYCDHRDLAGGGEEGGEDLPSIHSVKVEIDSSLASLIQSILWKSLLTVRYPSYRSPSSEDTDCSRYELNLRIKGFGSLSGKIECPSGSFQTSLTDFIDLVVKYSKENDESRARWMPKIKESAKKFIDRLTAVEGTGAD